MTSDLHHFLFMLRNAACDYFDRILDGSPPPRALLLDEFTAQAISLIASQSTLTERDVFFTGLVCEKFHRLDDTIQMSGVIFVRPTAENVEHIVNLLLTRQFRQINIFFSNILIKDDLRKIAHADKHEAIREVFEFFFDYLPISEYLFSLDLKLNYSLLKDVQFHDEEYSKSLKRSVEGITGVLFSLKIRPQVRFQGSSKSCRNAAISLYQNIESSFDMYNSQLNDQSSVLVILDRKEDPVTPLLTQWTYQAMIHEFFGIKSNRVDLSKQLAASGKKLKPENSNFVLSPFEDDFFQESMFLDLGELGEKIKSLVKSYEKKVSSNRKLNTMEDLQYFVDNYSDLVMQSGSVSKHVTLLSESNQIIDKRNLMKISALEQTLVCENNNVNAVFSVKELLRDQSIEFYDKLRVVILYSLRYETIPGNEIQGLKHLLEQQACNEDERKSISLVDEMLRKAGANRRYGDLFGANYLISNFSSGFKDVSNIYTQHKPYIGKIIQRFLKLSDKSLDMEFPCVVSSNSKELPKQLILYIIGGVTYEEAAFVADWNLNSKSSLKVLIGGTAVLNSKMFLDDISH